MAHAHSEPSNPIAKWMSAVWQSWENLFSFAGNARNIIATFAILMIGTAVTVGVYEIDRRALFPALGLDDAVGGIDLFVGLLIATIKASFVMAFFMHMLHEQRLIIRVMGFTALFFAAMLALCVWAFLDKPGDYFRHDGWANPYAAHGDAHGAGHGDDHGAAHPVSHEGDHGAAQEHQDTEAFDAVDDGVLMREAAEPGHGSPNHPVENVNPEGQAAPVDH